MIVRAATANPVKLEAIKLAFERYFDEEIEVIPKEVNSGVASQPINDEVFQGAKNRIEEVKKLEGEYDFLVSCEGGLVCQYGCWFNLQIVMVERNDGKFGFGLSQGFQIPDEYVEEAINTSIAKTMDRLFEGKGGVSVLTRGHFNRGKLVEDGTMMALGKVLEW